MRHDSRLSRTLHVLVHMDRHGGPLTSDTIAAMLGANPVVIRRTLAGLRDYGYLASGKGHGGGWRLARPLGEITLLDVYRALGAPEPFAIGLAVDHPECLVEQAVNASLAGAMREAAALLEARLGEVTLADVAADFDSRASVAGLLPG